MCEFKVSSSPSVVHSAAQTQKSYGVDLSRSRETRSEYPQRQHHVQGADHDQDADLLLNISRSPSSSHTRSHGRAYQWTSQPRSQRQTSFIRWFLDGLTAPAVATAGIPEALSILRSMISSCPNPLNKLPVVHPYMTTSTCASPSLRASSSVFFSISTSPPSVTLRCLTRAA